jgi:AraC family transcriptional regulator
VNRPVLAADFSDSLSLVEKTDATLHTGYIIMGERLNPIFRTIEKVSLIGAMVVYDSQAEASQRIPQQWRDLKARYACVGDRAKFCGASPCTADGKIHFLAGIEQDGAESPMAGEHLTLEAGEYAVVTVEDAVLRGDTWTQLLGSWLPASGRKEKHAPEFERYTGISEFGVPIGPIELWIPLEPIAGS